MMSFGYYPNVPTAYAGGMLTEKVRMWDIDKIREDSTNFHDFKQRLKELTLKNLKDYQELYYTKSFYIPGTFNAFVNQIDFDKLAKVFWEE